MTAQGRQYLGATSHTEEEGNTQGLMPPEQLMQPGFGHYLSYRLLPAGLQSKQILMAATAAAAFSLLLFWHLLLQSHGLILKKKNKFWRYKGSVKKVNPECYPERESQGVSCRIKCLVGSLAVHQPMSNTFFFFIETEKYFCKYCKNNAINILPF